MRSVPPKEPKLQTLNVADTNQNQRINVEADGTQRVEPGVAAEDEDEGETLEL